MTFDKNWSTGENVKVVYKMENSESFLNTFYWQ